MSSSILYDKDNIIKSVTGVTDYGSTITYERIGGGHCIKREQFGSEQLSENEVSYSNLPGRLSLLFVSKTKACIDEVFGRVPIDFFK